MDTTSRTRLNDKEKARWLNEDMLWRFSDTKVEAKRAEPHLIHRGDSTVTSRGLDNFHGGDLNLQEFVELFEDSERANLYWAILTLNDIALKDMTRNH